MAMMRIFFKTNKNLIKDMRTCYLLCRLLLLLLFIKINQIQCFFVIIFQYLSLGVNLAMFFFQNFIMVEWIYWLVFFRKLLRR